MDQVDVILGDGCGKRNRGEQFSREELDWGFDENGVAVGETIIQHHDDGAAENRLNRVTEDGWKSLECKERQVNCRVPVVFIGSGRGERL